MWMSSVYELARQRRQLRPIRASRESQLSHYGLQNFTAVRLFNLQLWAACVPTWMIVFAITTQVCLAENKTLCTNTKRQAFVNSSFWNISSFSLVLQVFQMSWRISLAWNRIMKLKVAISNQAVVVVPVVAVVMQLPLWNDRFSFWTYFCLHNACGSYTTMVLGTAPLCDNNERAMWTC